MTKPRLDRVIRAVCETPWAILPEKLDAITELLELKANGGSLTKDEIQARIGSRETSRAEIAGGIAVLPLFGVIAHRMNLMTEISGGTSCEQFGQWFDAAIGDPNISAVVLDIDSPGGTVEGVEELAAKIHAARGKKPIIAHANSLAASAAYWVAAACDEIVVTPSGLVGSIGVFTVHTDISEMDAKDGVKRTIIRAGKHKAEDTPFEPLSEEAREGKQAEVDEVYASFVRAIAKYRDVEVSEVTEGYGEGRALRARAALKAGLVDRVATMDAVLLKLGAGKSSGKARAEQPARLAATSEALPLVAATEVIEPSPEALAALVEMAQGREPHRPTVVATEDSGEWQAVAVPTTTGTDGTIVVTLTRGGITGVDVQASTQQQDDAPAVEARVPQHTPAPQAKEIAMPQDTPAPDRAEGTMTESREAALARLATMHKAEAKLPNWIVKGYAPDSAEVQADVRANYQERETNLRTGVPVVTVGNPYDSEKPFANLGEQLVAIAAHYSPSTLFSGAGRTDQRLFAAASGASAGVGGDGGFLIQKDFATDLMREGFDQGVLASQCSETEITGNSDALEVAYVDETSRATGSRWGGVRVYRVAEADTVTSSKPKIGRWDCRLEDLMGLAYMTERLIQDAPAMQSVFQEAFGEEFAFKLDDEIYRGSGAGECLGVLNAPALVSQPKESGQANDTIVAENVMKMWARVPLRSRLRGRWYFNIEAEPQMAQMQIGTGTSAQLVYMPPGGLSGQQYGTIYGRPALPIEHASALGDLGDIAFLDLSKYKLIRKGGLQQSESIHVRFLHNERAFKWTARVNGAPKDKTPLTPYKGAATATTSPFVSLAAR